MNFMWLLLTMNLLFGTQTVAPVVGIEKTGYIIVGDSRTVGMDTACDIAAHANVFVVAERSKGLWWLKHEGVAEIERIKISNPDVDHWTIVSNLGVNDLGSCENYVEFYKTFGDDFIFVSVNPVKSGASVTNESITHFNSRMREEFRYIDTNTMLQKKGYSAPDGLHYTESTYKLIFCFLLKELGIS